MIPDDYRPLPFSPMALDVHRATGDVVGRPAELQAIAQELATATTGRLVGLTVEGEPGIGKTRLLVAAAEQATADGFTAIAVTADEELRVRSWSPCRSWARLRRSTPPPTRRPLTR